MRYRVRYLRSLILVVKLRMRYLFALGMLASVMLAQTFRSTTTMVGAEALVEENGHVVTGLQSEDFTILDEDQPRPVASFGAESGSFRLVLLLDSSGSMQPKHASGNWRRLVWPLCRFCIPTTRSRS